MKNKCQILINFNIDFEKAYSNLIVVRLSCQIRIIYIMSCVKYILFSLIQDFSIKFKKGKRNNVV